MKILIIELSNLGDAILTYPALHALWNAYPQAEFHLLASPRTKELFSGEPRIHRVWEKRDPLIRNLPLIAELAGVGFHLVVDFLNSLIPIFLLGARRTRILRRSSRNGTHRVQAHLNLVMELLCHSREGGNPNFGATPLPFGPEEEAQVNQWLEPGRRPVVIVPGARSHLKRWAPEGFAAVADRLIQNHQAQILLVGEKEESSISEAVKKGMRGEATDLTGRTSIRQIAALFAKADLVITNDNACLHAAEAMGAPVVAVFGPTDEKKYGPRGPRSAVIRRRIICAPCELALCPTEHECMNWVEPAEVYESASRILTEGGRPQTPQAIPSVGLESRELIKP